MWEEQWGWNLYRQHRDGPCKKHCLSWDWKEERELKMGKPKREVFQADTSSSRCSRCNERLKKGQCSGCMGKSSVMGCCGGYEPCDQALPCGTWHGLEFNADSHGIS